MNMSSFQPKCNSMFTTISGSCCRRNQLLPYNLRNQACNVSPRPYLPIACGSFFISATLSSNIGFILSYKIGHLDQTIQLELFFFNTICSFNFQYYSDNLTIKSFRVAASRLRVSSHRLEVEKGRWKTPPVPYNNRLCYICQVLDDEFHFLFKCQSLQDLRVKYIKRYYYTRPSMNTLLQLLSNKNKAHIRNLSIFIKKGLTIKKMQLPRTQVITNVLQLYTEFQIPKSKYIGINTHCILFLYMCLTLDLESI